MAAKKDARGGLKELLHDKETDLVTVKAQKRAIDSDSKASVKSHKKARVDEQGTCKPSYLTIV